MKKIICIIAICLNLNSVNAQEINETDVPADVKTAFLKMYPGVKKAKWDIENNQFEASFTNGLYKGSVLFDSAGKWTEREKSIPLANLPQKIKSYMQMNYKNQKLLGAAKIIKATGEIMYEAEIKGNEIFFTKDGEFIKEG